MYSKALVLRARSLVEFVADLCLVDENDATRRHERSRSSSFVLLERTLNDQKVAKSCLKFLSNRLTRRVKELRDDNMSMRLDDER
jgi:hypothetical protein